uniref:Uncharacterized protein n=1 Tax=Molossus molossus TaxID=27622 RepID=A0A7J8CS43_MOLMO|nr:hypothetical protein HJG59_009773 [Molossus molossus]
MCGCVCPFFSIPGDRGWSVNECVTFLQFIIPRFLLGVGAPGRPDEGPWEPRPQVQTSFLPLLTSQICLHPLLPLNNWAFAKVITGVIQCSSPPQVSHSFQGQWARGPPPPPQLNTPFPLLPAVHSVQRD